MNVRRVITVRRVRVQKHRVQPLVESCMSIVQPNLMQRLIAISRWRPRCIWPARPAPAQQHVRRDIIVRVVISITAVAQQTRDAAAVRVQRILVRARQVVQTVQVAIPRIRQTIRPRHRSVRFLVRRVRRLQPQMHNAQHQVATGTQRHRSW